MTEKSQDTENKGRFNNIEHKQKLKIIKYDRAVKDITRGKKVGIKDYFGETTLYEKKEKSRNINKTNN